MSVALSTFNIPLRVFPVKRPILGSDNLNHPRKQRGYHRFECLRSGHGFSLGLERSLQRALQRFAPDHGMGKEVDTERVESFHRSTR